MYARLILALLAPLTLAGPARPREASATPENAMRARNLQTEYRVNPLGLDADRPRLTWKNVSSRPGEGAPTAHQVIVATSPERLAGGLGDAWDSGKVAGAAPRMAYAGQPLASGARYHWKVRSWDAGDTPGPWSEPAWFEMGWLEDWPAAWIGALDHRAATPVTLRFPARTARYVRLRVTRLGIPLPDGVERNARPRLQLGEIEVISADDERRNLALHRPATASDAVDNREQWAETYLTDGNRYTDGVPAGYSSLPRDGRDTPDDPVWVEVDLGADRRFDEVRLWPRTDLPSAEGGTPNFPTDYTIETRASGDPRHTIAAKVTGQAAPPRPESGPPPLLARDFELDKPIERARLYVTGLGRYEARLNGGRVGEDELEPGDTDYRKTVAYAAHDVTDALRPGPNTLGIMLANGIYNLRAEPGRYHKLTNVWGRPRARALLVVEHPDGSTTRVATDPQWMTAPGPLLYSGHYGGEDYDARRERPGWDAPGFDRSDWTPVEALEDSEPAPRLVARSQPPIRIVETMAPVAITEPEPGVFVADFGRNMAGFPELRASGPAGTVVRLRPSEVLHRDGTVDQSTTGSPIYNTYTMRGGGPEVWRPRFVYHGFRYLEVTGLPGGPNPGNLRAHAIRAANPRHGTFETSHDLINRIHGLIDGAVASNMMSVLTDCPHREKLGWLEAAHLMFESISFNFDTVAWYEKILGDMRDAQLPNGLIPDIAPEYTVFVDGFRDDPNWGGAILFVPWALYQTTGDPTALERNYTAMRRYLDYLTGRADGHILSHGLGDWISPADTTPLPLVATASYYRQARIMAGAAKLLGRRDDAARYVRLAADIREAFHARFRREDGGLYGSGDQASIALPLHAGLVPDEGRRAAVDALAASLRESGSHITTGEIALPAVLLSLMDAGRDDLIHAFANLTEHPSYGYQVAHGATTLTEAWDGPESADPRHDGPVISQNHCILGHIEEWFYSGLAGIRRTSPGWRTLDIRPFIPDDVEWVKAGTETVLGPVASSWRKGDDGTLTMEVTVPMGASARVFAPATSAGSVTVNGDEVGDVEGASFEGIVEGRAVLALAPGTWRLECR